jgi:2-haloacid dehalogenase
MFNPAGFDLLTFDCYGTLIDWETGIFSALKPLLSAHGKPVPDAQLLELYSDFEFEAESGTYQTYREVLRSVVQALGKRLSFTPSMKEVNALNDSFSNWPPWPDTVAALKRLAKRYRLAVISNTDDDLFAQTRRYLPIEFETVTTAQQARCYKPALEIFRLALGKAKVDPKRILHVGQSIYHDVLPAQSLGLATVWVNRPSPRAGIGAVKEAKGQPDLQVPDLETLAALLTEESAARIPPAP